MPELKKVMDTLKYISQDEKARAIADMREKALLDHRSSLNHAKRVGREEGLKEAREEGKKEVRLEVAKNMLAVGLDVQLVLQVTKLTEQEIEALRSGLPVTSAT